MISKESLVRREEREREENLSIGRSDGGDGRRFWRRYGNFPDFVVYHQPLILEVTPDLGQLSR